MSTLDVIDYYVKYDGKKIHIIIAKITICHKKVLKEHTTKTANPNTNSMDWTIGV